MYTTAIHLNSFKNIMADKAVWRINRGRINEYSLYIYIYIYIYIYNSTATGITSYRNGGYCTGHNYICCQ